MEREEAIKKLQKQKAEYLKEWVDFSGVAEAYDMAIEALAEQKTGEWTEKDGECVCSECGNSVSFSWTEDGWVLGKFCQTCGAKMGVNK